MMRRVMTSLFVSVLATHGIFAAQEQSMDKKHEWTNYKKVGYYVRSFTPAFVCVASPLVVGYLANKSWPVRSGNNTGSKLDGINAAKVGTVVIGAGLVGALFGLGFIAQPMADAEDRTFVDLMKKYPNQDPKELLVPYSIRDKLPYFSQYYMHIYVKEYNDAFYKARIDKGLKAV